MTMNNSERDVLDYHLRLYNECKTNRQPMHPTWKRGMNHWLVKHDIGKWPSRVRLKLPYINQSIEQNASRAVPIEPNIHVGSYLPDMQEITEGIQENLLEVWQKNRMPLRIQDYEKSKFIYGTTFAFVGYERKTRKVKRWEPVLDEQGEPVIDWERGDIVKELVEKEEIVHDCPTFRPVHIGDVWHFPSKAQYIDDDVEGIILRVAMSLEAMQAAKGEDGKPMYKHLDMVKEGCPEHVGDLTREQISDIVGLAHKDEESEILGYNGKTDDKRKKEVVCLQIWRNERLTIIADGHVLVRDDDNPYDRIPFVMDKDVSIPGQLYGRPHWRFVESLTVHTDMIFSLLIEQLHHLVLPAWLYDKEAIKNENDLFLQAGKGIAVNTHKRPLDQVIKYVKKEAVSQDVMIAINKITDIYEETTGITKQVKGDTGGARLATDIVTANSNSQLNFEHKQLTTEELTFNPMLERWIDYMRKYWTEERFLQFFTDDGPQTFVLTPEHLAMDWHIKYDSRSIDPSNAGAAARQKYIEILSVLTGGDPSFMTWVKPRAIVKRAFKEGWKIPDYEECIKTIEEFQEEQQNAIMEGLLGNELDQRAQGNGIPELGPSQAGNGGGGIPEGDSQGFTDALGMASPDGEMSNPYPGA